MFIRFYVYADNEENALRIYRHCKNNVQKYIKKEQLDSVTPYWKFSDMYVLEVSFTWSIKAKQFEFFLDSICDYWCSFGRPLANEFSLLASETNKDCTYMQNSISMIEILFENDAELHMLPSKYLSHT